jgi:RHS repeat-associated protein
VSSARYEYGIDLLRGQFGTVTPTSLWYYSDALGSVTALSNASGALQTAYGYNAWGERTVGSDWGGAGSPLNNLNAVGYTGQFFDSETGLQPLGNGERYYSASLGRFTQQDSFSGVLGETASLNRYAYGHNNPIINTDPSGHIIPLIIAAVVVGAILGAAGGAAIGGGSEVIRQTAQKWDGTRTDYDWDQVGSAAKTGAAFGAAVGGLGAIPGFGQVLAAGLVGTMTVVGTYQGINSASDEFSQGHYWTGAVDTIFTAVGAVTGVRGVKGHWNNRSTGTTPSLERVKRWRGTGKTTPETVVERPEGAEVGKEPLLMNSAPEEVQRPRFIADANGTVTDTTTPHRNRLFETVLEAEEQLRSVRTKRTAKQQGPVVGAALDPMDGYISRTYTNVKELPAKLHRLLKDRATEINDDPVLSKRHEHSTPGTHAEILALDELLKRRETMFGRDATIQDLQELETYQRWLTKPSNPAKMCPHCTYISEGATSIPGNNVNGPGQKKR